MITRKQREPYFQNYVLLPHEVVEIRIMAKHSDYTTGQLAKHYAISPSHISNLKHYRFWKELRVS